MASDAKIVRFTLDSVNRDRLDIDLAPNEWSSVTQALARRGGYETPLNDVAAFGAGPSQCRHLLYSPNSAANYWIAVDITGVYVTDQSTWKTITPTPWNAGNANIWTSGRLNGQPFINNGTNGPITWGFDFATPTACTGLTGFPASTSCKSLRAFRDFLVAMNINSSGTLYPDQVLWSDRANAGALPTTWTAAATNEAGDTTLTGSSSGADGAGIVDGLEGPGQGFTIYKGNSAYYMQEIGLPQVMGVRKLFDGIGALALNCVQAWPGGGHIVVTQGDVVIHDGNQAQSIIDGTLRNWLFDNIADDEQAKVFTALDPYNKEFWVTFNHNTGQTYNRIALVWNGRAWGYRDLPSNTSTFSTGGYSHIASGYIDTEHRPVLLAASNSAASAVNRVVHVSGTSTGTPQVTTCAKLGIRFVEGKATTVKRVRPLGDGIHSSALSLDIVVEVRASPKSTSAVLHTIDYADAEDGWVSCPATGFEHGFTFTANASKYFRLTGFEVEFEPAGRFVG